MLQQFTLENDSFTKAKQQHQHSINEVNVFGFRAVISTKTVLLTQYDKNHPIRVVLVLGHSRVS